MRRGTLGTDNLNAILQETLNPQGEEIERFGRKYRLRDRVMQIRNNYDKEVFNGDIGSIVAVDPEERDPSLTWTAAAWATILPISTSSCMPTPEPSTNRRAANTLPSSSS
jgi:ATP-dependent exoDNAse (exonuclease V) alpha subunit